VFFCPARPNALLCFWAIPTSLCGRSTTLLVFMCTGTRPACPRCGIPYGIYVLWYVETGFVSVQSIVPGLATMAIVAMKATMVFTCSELEFFFFLFVCQCSTSIVDVLATMVCTCLLGFTCVCLGFGCLSVLDVYRSFNSYDFTSG
jgi:hypothetical protein